MNIPEKYKVQREPRNSKLPIPPASSQAFRQAENQKGLYNIGLYFDRYIQFADFNWQMDYELSKRNDHSKTDKYNAKVWNLQKIANTHIEKNQKWDGSIFEAAVNRWLEMVKDNPHFKCRPEWRFIVGLGDKTALEVGFTFHRIYGFPIIPGSALKGLTRAYALWELAEALGVPRLPLSEVKKRTKAKKEKRCHTEPCETPYELLDELLLANDERIQDGIQVQKAKETQEKAWDKLRKDPAVQIKINQFRRIFGTQHAAGEAIFLDAMPAEFPRLEIDVMNVHYPDYYGEQGTKLPSDNQNPKPIPFLTVGQSAFWFAVGWRGQPDKALQDQVVTWLQKGLTEFGIGAKTSAGYGYFEIIK